MPDALRLAIGTLTRLPVPVPRTVDARVARGAMLLAPLVGALLAVVVGGVAQLLQPRVSAAAGPLVLSALAIATIAYVTRGLHLDGLADTADALGSGRPANEALDIARRSDIGPFGVVTIVLVLLVQVA
ncbi:MAG: adenosylcobinamide-GDP ribazoletransferase, partial [Actinobacteria bacterium]|nr:adenosylcobinamide-GDP ribazoletransferase [Actinomycetota bacterium]